MIYLDNNATTKLDEEVFKAMEPYLKGEYFGNPSSLHTAGRIVRDAVEESREKVASFLNCSNDEIIFTSGGTESINAAISSFNKNINHSNILISSVEHAAVSDFAAQKIEKGSVIKIGVNANGIIDLDQLKLVLDETVSLISIIYAHNETGVLSPVSEISEICSKKGIICHFDAVQAVGKIPVDLSQLECELLSLSGHKIHGPKGIGALYVKDGHKMEPFQFGGGQEKGIRAGTESVASIVGLGKACEIAYSDMKKNTTKLLALRDGFEKAILKKFDSAVIVGSEVNRLPNTSNICFGGYEAESLIPLLDQLGICVSHGSACSSGSWGPPRVLTEMGYTDSIARGSLRFSFSKYNEEKEIKTVITGLEQALSILDTVQN